MWCVRERERERDVANCTHLSLPSLICIPALTLVGKVSEIGTLDLGSSALDSLGEPNFTACDDLLVSSAGLACRN